MCLEGRLVDDQAQAARGAVTAWLDPLPVSTRDVSPTGGPVHYHGGALMHWEAAHGATLAVRIHSSGEDAFDATDWYSAELAGIARAAAPGAGFTWHPWPHERTARRLVTAGRPPA